MEEGQWLRVGWPPWSGQPLETLWRAAGAMFVGSCQVPYISSIITYRLFNIRIAGERGFSWSEQATTVPEEPAQSALLYSYSPTVLFCKKCAILMLIIS